MKIYAVNRKDYDRYRTSEIEKIHKQVEDVSDEQVITEVNFTTPYRDFSIVDSALLGLLRKQYDTKAYIAQNDLKKIEKELNKINKNEMETLNEVLWNKGNFYVVDDILDIIKNIDNYMMIYLTNEEELGRFIVSNLDIFEMPPRTLNNIEMHLNFKAIAEEYLFERNIEVIGIEDIVLDISKNKDDQLIQKLIEQELDSKTISAKKYEHKKGYELEEDFEFEGE